MTSHAASFSPPPSATYAMVLPREVAVEHEDGVLGGSGRHGAEGRHVVRITDPQRSWDENHLRTTTDNGTPSMPPPVEYMVSAGAPTSAPLSLSTRDGSGNSTS